MTRRPPVAALLGMTKPGCIAFEMALVYAPLMRLSDVLLGALGIATFACSSSKDGPATALEAGTQSDGGNDGGFPDVAAPGDGAPEADVACSAPDVLIVLDRTLAMARRPDGTRPLDTPS